MLFAHRQGLLVRHFINDEAERICQGSGCLDSPKCLEAPVPGLFPAAAGHVPRCDAQAGGGRNLALREADGVGVYRLALVDYAPGGALIGPWNGLSLATERRSAGAATPT